MTDHRFGGPFVITGLSGSGKTVLSRSLEDIGYLCVDNIPLELVASLFDTTHEDTERLAVVLASCGLFIIAQQGDFFQSRQTVDEGLVALETFPVKR